MIAASVSGSFHRHMQDIARAVNELAARSVRVLSPADPRVVAHAVRVVTLVDGRVARDEPAPGEPPHEIVRTISADPALR